MSVLHFLYETGYQFEYPLAKHHFTIKCFPGSDEKQEVKELELKIFPDVSYMKSLDAFGNKIAYGSYQELHQQFSFAVSGTVETGKSDSISAEETAKLGMYRYPGSFTKPGEKLTSFYQRTMDSVCDFKNNFDKTLFLMNAVYTRMQYKMNSTTIFTTAEEAMQLGTGVCQDYAHIMLSLCRMHHIAARYVVGMMIGEGASHAWVEVEDQGRWYGFDPTHNQIVNQHYIKISHGRDYEDCIIDKGILIGGGRQSQSIHVTASEVV